MKQPRILALAGVAALLAAACSGGASGSAAPSPQASIGDGRGRAQPCHVGRLRGARRDRPGVRLGHPVRDEDRLQGQHHRHDRLQQRRRAHAVRRVRRHLRVRRRHHPAHRRRHRRPGQHLAVPNYANVFAGLKDLPHNTVDGVNYGVPHGRGPNLLDVQHRRRHARAHQLGRPCGRAAPTDQGKISVYDSSIYIADAALHLMTNAPGARASTTRTSSTRRSSTRPSSCSRPAGQRGDLYWGTCTDQIARTRPATSRWGRPGSTR